MLGTSDAWTMSRLSHRPSDPAYYIEDCGIFVYFYMSSHFQDGVLLPHLGDATSSKSIRTKTDREKACHDKNNSTVTEFIFLPQLQWESNAFIDSLMSKIRFGSSVILSLKQTCNEYFAIPHWNLKLPKRHIKYWVLSGILISYLTILLEILQFYLVILSAIHIS